jgi:hypothetical protein
MSGTSLNDSLGATRHVGELSLKVLVFEVKAMVKGECVGLVLELWCGTSFPATSSSATNSLMLELLVYSQETKDLKAASTRILSP